MVSELASKGAGGRLISIKECKYGTRAVFDSKTKKISVVNTFLAAQTDIELKAELLGVNNQEELYERIKQSGGIKKFLGVAQEALNQSRKRSK